jgi:hypothetical protein
MITLALLASVLFVSTQMSDRRQARQLS